MTTEILCPNCSKRLRVNSQSRSRRLRCPVCQSEMSLSVSGESVTATIIAGAALPEPPPLPPPVYRTPAAVEELQPEVAAEEPQLAAALDEPQQPMIQLSATPQNKSHAPRSSGNKPGTQPEAKENNSALWIGGGIGLLLVAIVTVGGFLWIGGLSGGGGKSLAQSSKTGDAKKKVAAKEKELLAPELAIDRSKLTKPSVPAPTESAEPGALPAFPPAADFSPPGTSAAAVTPIPEIPGTPEKPAPETSPSAPEKPAVLDPEPAKSPPAKEKTKPSKTKPKAGAKKADAKGEAKRGPPPTTADCEVCRGRGLVPLQRPQPYVWMESQPVPKGGAAVREQYCPNCKPDADHAELAAAEDLRLKTAMGVHLDWEKKTNWQLVRAENRRAAFHSQLPPAETQRVALAVEAMNLHIEELTGSVELTATTPANLNVIVLFQKPNYTQFVNLLKADPVLGPSRQDWALVGEVAGSWVKETIFYRYVPDGPPPDHQAIALVSSYQIRTATGYKDPAWLNVGYATYCENATLKSNRVTSLEYALNNLQIDPDWSQAVHRLAAAGGLKPWNDMFPKILRDYQAEDHLTSYAMVSFLIQYKPRKFLDFIKETKGGLGSVEALEKAYGETVPQLQQRWVKALGGR